MRKLNMTDRQTDRQTDGRTGGVAISPVPGPTAPAGDNNMVHVLELTSITMEVCYISTIRLQVSAKMKRDEHMDGWMGGGGGHLPSRAFSTAGDKAQRKI